MLTNSTADLFSEMCLNNADPRGTVQVGVARCNFTRDHRPFSRQPSINRPIRVRCRCHQTRDVIRSRAPLMRESLESRNRSYAISQVTRDGAFGSRIASAFVSALYRPIAAKCLVSVLIATFEGSTVLLDKRVHSS